MNHNQPLRNLEEAVLAEARELLLALRNSADSNPPDRSGPAAQVLTAWVPSHRVESLLDATYALVREEQRNAT